MKGRNLTILFSGFWGSANPNYTIFLVPFIILQFSFVKSQILTLPESKILIRRDTAYFNALPFTGLILSNIEGGLCGSYIEGLKEGRFIEYYPNKQKKSECYFKGNQLDGLCTEWYESGNVKSESIYHLGRKDGLCVNWYDQFNKKKSIAYYINGSLTDQFTCWYESGRIQIKMQYQNDQPFGKYEEWYDSDQKMKKLCNYNDGVLIAPCKIWDIHGNLLFDTTGRTDTVFDTERLTEKPIDFRNSLDGNFTANRIDSMALMSPDNIESNFVADQYIHVIEYYANSVNISMAGTLKNGKRDSIWTYWYPNNKMERRGRFKDNMEVGAWIYWDSKGDSLKCIEFEKGVPIATINYAELREKESRRKKNQRMYEFLGFNGMHEDSFLVRLQFNYPEDDTAKVFMSNILEIFRQRFTLMDDNSNEFNFGYLKDYYFEFGRPVSYVTMNYNSLINPDSTSTDNKQTHISFNAHSKTNLKICSQTSKNTLYDRVLYEEARNFGSKERAAVATASLLNNKIKHIINFYIGMKCRPTKWIESQETGRELIGMDIGKNIGVEVGSQFWVYDKSSDYWPIAKLLVHKVSNETSECFIFSDAHKNLKTRVEEEGLYARYISR